MHIVIHIGWHKTGTTSVQQFLFENANRLIEQHNTYYPREGLFHSAHHNIAWSIQNRKMSPWGQITALEGGAEKYISEAVETAKTNDCTTVIFSSEDFCTLKLHEIQSLHNALHKHASELTIIAYIRRQDLIVESTYNMRVKWWGVRSTVAFAEHIKGKEMYPNYFGTLRNWANTFGLRALIIRPFVRKLFEKNDIRRDFCKQLKIDYTNLALKDSPSNDSLGPRSMEFLRILNNLEMTRDAHERIVALLLDYDKTVEAPSCVLFEPDQRVAFLQFSKDTNMHLVELGIEMDALVLDVDKLPASNVKKLSLEDFREMMGLFNRLSN